MTPQATWGRVVAGIVLFGAAFGYVEAAVVAYLRAIYGPLHTPLNELFPLFTLDQLRGLGQEHWTRLRIELGRELATLLMLAGAGLLGGRNTRERIEIFLACFGIWDITFYLWLKVLIDWPASLLTWDLLFLIPVPWAGPVIAPVLVAISMIAVGLAMLWREYHGSPIEIDGKRWIAIVAGGILVFIAFIADFRNTTNGGYPKAFHWGVFLVGEASWLLAVWTAFR